MTNSLMSKYLHYTMDTESPKQFHRWAIISCVAAKLGRNIYIPFGHGNIYPNMYVMLVGVPAARKSTAVKIAQKLCAASGYQSFAFTKSSREKFLMDFELGFQHVAQMEKTDIAKVLAGELTELDMLALMDAPAFPLDPASEVFVCCDEFVDFIGQKNINFINTLTTLWDNLDTYPERLKNSKSVNIPRPTVNLLGGITPVSFSTAMPPEVVGQGFMSRVILVYAEPNKRKITFPTLPDETEREALAALLRRVSKLHGECTLEPEAKHLIDAIYQNYENIPDVRLQYYCARRLDHLLKLCMVIAAMNNTLKISVDFVIEANTILVYTENYMSKALGEFGEAKNAKATQKIIEILTQRSGPVSTEDIWVAVSQDLDRFQAMGEILQNLHVAKKIIISNGNVMLNRSPLSKNVIGVDIVKYIQEVNSIEDISDE
jgi:hypothetical protein